MEHNRSSSLFNKHKDSESCITFKSYFEEDTRVKDMVIKNMVEVGMVVVENFEENTFDFLNQSKDSLEDIGVYKEGIIDCNSDRDIVSLASSDKDTLYLILLIKSLKFKDFN